MVGYAPTVPLLAIEDSSSVETLFSTSRLELTPSTFTTSGPFSFLFFCSDFFHETTPLYYFFNYRILNCGCSMKSATTDDNVYKLVPLCCRCRLIGCTFTVTTKFRDIQCLWYGRCTRMYANILWFISTLFSTGGYVCVHSFRP